MTKMIKSNYFILTGAMGGGKSTILARLAESSVYCVPEPARALLAEQRNLYWKEFEGEKQVYTYSNVFSGETNL